MKTVVTLLIVLWAAQAAAQTGPCDVLSSAGTSFTGTVNQSTTLTVCEIPKDASGDPIVTVQGWTAYLDGVATALPLTAGPASGVTGAIPWSGAYILPSTVGTHTLQVTVTGANATGTMLESPKSSPLALTVKPAPESPQAPENLLLH